VKEVGVAAVLDHRLLDRARKAEVELLQGLARREARGFDPGFAAVAVAGGDLGVEQDLGEAFVAPGLLAGPLGQRWQRPRRRWRFQGAEEMGELGGLAHAGIKGS